ncbi:MAG TPA: DHH family phosphoesterase [Burkholderiales bacterium]|jgi:hypothetical protein|nr:DHH family phosphoesterase [Burkholderiales bacterium]
MRFYDIFNGDADGICGLLQLRFAQPREAVLITGVKRDVKLLDRVDAERGDHLTVLDISLDANRAALERALEAGARVEWFDHHYAGRIPPHPGLAAHIDTDPALCTSLIVDRHLGGRFRRWAIVAAFGDNLEARAQALAREIGLSSPEIGALRELGVYINYNAYGESVADLLFAPEALYRRLRAFVDPLDFVRAGTEFVALKRAYLADLSRAHALPIEVLSAGCALVKLPDEAWSRRAVGTFANRLAQEFPQRAHAVLVKRGHGYLVSLRAPLARPRGALAIAQRFASGGGREAAAGIDYLPEAELPKLIEALRTEYP